MDNESFFNAVKEAWNKEARKNKFTQAFKITDKRKSRILEVKKDLPEIKQWIGAISAVKSNSWNLGEGGWYANLDWFINTKDNAIKYYEIYLSNQEKESRLKELEEKLLSFARP